MGSHSQLLIFKHVPLSHNLQNNRDQTDGTQLATFSLANVPRHYEHQGLLRTPSASPNHNDILLNLSHGTSKEIIRSIDAERV